MPNKAPSERRTQYENHRTGQSGIESAITELKNLHKQDCKNELSKWNQNKSEKSRGPLRGLKSEVTRTGQKYTKIQI